MSYCAKLIEDLSRYYFNRVFDLIYFYYIFLLNVIKSDVYLHAVCCAQCAAISWNNFIIINH